MPKNAQPSAHAVPGKPLSSSCPEGRSCFLRLRAPRASGRLLQRGSGKGQWCHTVSLAASEGRGGLPEPLQLLTRQPGGDGVPDLQRGWARIILASVLLATLLPKTGVGWPLRHPQEQRATGEGYCKKKDTASSWEDYPVHHADLCT